MRKLKYLAPLSTIGNIITIISFGVIFYYIFREPLTLEGKRPYATLSEFPMFFGTVLFALEAIGVVRCMEIGAEFLNFICNLLNFHAIYL